MSNKTYGQSSSPRDRTLLICEPRFRWMPEHSMHMRIPKFKLAHSGSVRRWEPSKKIFHIDFPLSCTYLAHHSPHSVHCPALDFESIASMPLRSTSTVSLWPTRCPVTIGKFPAQWPTPIRPALPNWPPQSATVYCPATRCKIRMLQNLKSEKQTL